MVFLGDGSTKLPILGKGTVERWVETSPHAYRLLVLYDVLHIDGIKCCFLSTSQFNSKGFTVLMGQSKVMITMRKFHFSGFKASTLYTCTMYGKKPLGHQRLNSVKALPIKTWHEHMGHLNWDAIKTVQSNNPPLHGVKLDSSLPPSNTCPGCAAGKAKRHMFQSSST